MSGNSIARIPLRRKSRSSRSRRCEIFTAALWRNISGFHFAELHSPESPDPAGSTAANKTRCLRLI